MGGADSDFGAEGEAEGMGDGELDFLSGVGELDSDFLSGKGLPLADSDFLLCSDGNGELDSASGDAEDLGVGDSSQSQLSLLSSCLPPLWLSLLSSDDPAWACLRNWPHSPRIMIAAISLFILDCGLRLLQ